MVESREKSPFSEEELKSIAKKKILMKLGFKIHLVAFIGANIALLVINYLTSGLTRIWFVYPLAGWFMGIVAHLACYMIYARGVIGAQKIGVIMNASIYAASVPALLVINYFSYFGYMWFLWPAIFWFLGVLIQAIAWKMTGVKHDVQKSWIDRNVEKELEKAKKKHGGN